MEPWCFASRWFVMPVVRLNRTESKVESWQGNCSEGEMRTLASETLWKSLTNFVGRAVSCMESSKLFVAHDPVICSSGSAILAFRRLGGERRGRSLGDRQDESLSTSSVHTCSPLH